MVIPTNVIKAKIPCIKRIIKLSYNTGKKPINDKLKLDNTENKRAVFFNLKLIFLFPIIEYI